jgi:hypothetical protein
MPSGVGITFIVVYSCCVLIIGVFLLYSDYWCIPAVYLLLLLYDCVLIITSVLYYCIVLLPVGAGATFFLKKKSGVPPGRRH